LCVITQRAVVISYRRFGTTDSYKTHKYTVLTELIGLNVCVVKWVFVCVGFVIVGVLVICVLVFTIFCIVSFMHVFSYSTSLRTTATE